MKKVLYIAGGVIGLLTPVTAMFVLGHWPGAKIYLIAYLTLLVIVSIVAAIYFAKDSKNKKLVVFDGIAIVLFLLAIIARVANIHYVSILFIPSTFLFQAAAILTTIWLVDQDKE